MPEPAGRLVDDGPAPAKSTQARRFHGAVDPRQPSGIAGPDDAASAPRRTVVIRGQVADRYGPRPAPRRRASPYGRVQVRPERAALWAVLLGFALVLAVIASARL